MITTFIQAPLKRMTFQSPKMKQWVEDRFSGLVLNLFAGDTKLDLQEIRNDIREDAIAEYHLDALDFVKSWDAAFDTIILDPPYSYRKAMEMYDGKYSSKFRQIADEIPRILSPNGKVIHFGYHSTFMGKIRKFGLEELCVFGHGGAQHCTIAIIERRRYENAQML